MNKNHISQCCGAEIGIQGQLDDYIYYFCIKCLKRYDFFGSPSPEQPSQEDWEKKFDTCFPWARAYRVIPPLFDGGVQSAGNIIQSGDIELKAFIKSLLSAARKAQDLKTRQECAEVLPDPYEWLHEQGYDGDEAFTTGDLQEILEFYQKQAKQKILNQNNKDE